jgi:hypothetical protein
MRHRPITKRQADEILSILIEECGYADSYDGRGFVNAIVTEDMEDARHVCDEYRFMGRLGFGGKFRNNGNNENTPYVDCYSESRTPKLDAMIERANARLKTLFDGAP